MWCVRMKLDKAVACWIITGDWVPGRRHLPADRMDPQPKPKRHQPAIDRRSLRRAGAPFPAAREPPAQRLQSPRWRSRLQDMPRATHHRQQNRSSSPLSCSRAPRIRDFAYGLLSPICAYNTPTLHVRTAVRNLQPRHASQSCLCRFNPKPQEAAAVKVIYTVSVRSGGSAQILGAKSTTSPRSTINWLAAIVSAERPLYSTISHEGGYER